MAPDTLKNNYFALRHGQSKANVAGLVISAPANGVDRYGLTHKGEQQVKSSVSAFSGLDRHTLIFSSDFKRARETAGIAARVLSSRDPVNITPKLRERFFGEFELGPDTIYQSVWEKDAGDAAPGNHVEPASDVLKRVLACISGIEAAQENKNILLVSHGDTLQITLAWFSGKPAHCHRDMPPLATAELRRAG